jgi:hypothetical protein
MLEALGRITERLDQIIRSQDRVMSKDQIDYDILRRMHSFDEQDGR